MGLAKNTLIVFLNRIFLFLIGIGIQSILARVLGPEGKGAYTLIILLPVMLTTIGVMGIDSAAVYFIGRKKYPLEKIVSNIVFFSITFGFIFTFWGVIFNHFFGEYFFKDINLTFIYLTLFFIPFGLLTVFSIHILRALDKFRKAAFIDIVNKGTLLVLIFLFLTLWKMGLLGGALAWAGATVIAALFSLFLIDKETEIKLRFDKNLFKESFKFGIKSHVGRILMIFLNKKLEIFLLAFFLNPVAVGFYSVAIAFSDKLREIGESFAITIFPKVSSIREKTANKITPIVCRNVILLFLLAGIFITVFGRWIIVLLFGRAFLPSLTPLLILLPGILMYGVFKILANHLTGRGQPIHITQGAATALIVNIILNVLLIPYWGVVGAALASTISYTVAALIILIIFVKKTKIPLKEILFFKSKDLIYYRSIFDKVIKRRNA